MALSGVHGPVLVRVERNCWGLFIEAFCHLFVVSVFFSCLACVLLLAALGSFKHCC